MSTNEQLGNFIVASFRSVWALELLCLLRRHRDRSMSHEELVAGLRASQLVVTQGLESLSAAGLVVLEADDRARYAPASKALDNLVAATEEFYARSPDAVRRIIVSSASPSLTAFADAFRLRRD
jgi:hypothetical protein